MPEPRYGDWLGEMDDVVLTLDEYADLLAGDLGRIVLAYNETPWWRWRKRKRLAFEAEYLHRALRSLAS